jgi:subtilisin-like proprotein convertase family protein
MRKVKILIIFVLLVQPAAAGGTVVETYTFTPGAPIPDYVLPGAAMIETIAGSQIRSITDVDVELIISHTSNGQIYAMLLHGSEVVVLLDATGATPGLPLGYDDDGFDIVLDDEGPDDGMGTGIHQYQLITGGTLPPGTPLTGAWAPDLDGTNGTLPDYPLSRFDGLDADGQWTLVVSDCGLGETGIVVQWSLFLEGDTLATAAGDTPPPKGLSIWAVPNPFNPGTTIHYGVPDDGHVTIRVYDVRGAVVRTILSGRREPGVYTEEWDGTDDRSHHVGSGVYFCRIDAGGHSEVQKLVLLK